MSAGNDEANVQFTNGLGGAALSEQTLHAEAQRKETAAHTLGEGANASRRGAQSPSRVLRECARRRTAEDESRVSACSCAHAAGRGCARACVTLRKRQQ
eukprot:2920771-Pleurochrysis_carterae.AAC.2